MNKEYAGTIEQQSNSDAAENGASVLSCYPAEFEKAAKEALEYIKTVLPAEDATAAAAVDTVTTAVDALASLCKGYQEEGRIASEMAKAVEAVLEELRKQAKLYQRRQFGPKREKNPNAGGGGRPAEPKPAGQDPESSSKDADTEGGASKASKAPPPKEKKPRTPRGRSGASICPKGPHVKEREVHHPLPDDQKICPQCGTPLVFMTMDEQIQLGILQACMERIVHKREVWKCPKCGKDGDKSYIVRAEMPKSPVPGSFAAPSAMAYLIWQKHVLGVPHYRLAQNTDELGYRFSRQTMNNISIACAKALLPVYSRLGDLVLESDTLHADETRLQVLREPGREAKQQSFEMVLVTGREEPHQIQFFQYNSNRTHDCIKDLIKDFSGTLHSDGYDGYHVLGDDVLVIGCWCHLRRKVFDAVSVLDPEDQVNMAFPEVQFLQLIDRLFDLEREFEGLSAEDRKEARLAKSAPVLDEIKAFLDAHQECDALLAKAVTYAGNQWPYLTNFLEDGACEIHNNRAERIIRTFVNGRKNWLFAVSPDGAETLSIFHTILGTAKLNGVHPQSYLKWLLERIAAIDCDDQEALDRLMPWNAPSELHESEARSTHSDRAA